MKLWLRQSIKSITITTPDTFGSFSLKYWLAADFSCCNISKHTTYANSRSMTSNFLSNTSENVDWAIGTVKSLPTLYWKDPWAKNFSVEANWSFADPLLCLGRRNSSILLRISMNKVFETRKFLMNLKSNEMYTKIILALLPTKTWFNIHLFESL